MFGEHFNLQKNQNFLIGQGLSALALFVVPGTKVPAYIFPVFLLHIA